MALKWQRWTHASGDWEFACPKDKPPLYTNTKVFLRKHDNTVQLSAASAIALSKEEALELAAKLIELAAECS